MTQEFIPYEQALALKELGFDEPCFGIWMERSNKHDVIYVAKQEDAWMAEENDGILAPLYQQAFRWFREKHELAHNIHPITYDCYVVNQKYIKIYDIGDFNRYEEAELACLIKLVELVKQK